MKLWCAESLLLVIYLCAALDNTSAWILLHQSPSTGPEVASLVDIIQIHLTVSYGNI